MLMNRGSRNSFTKDTKKREGGSRMGQRIERIETKAGEAGRPFASLRSHRWPPPSCSRSRVLRYYDTLVSCFPAKLFGPRKTRKDTEGDFWSSALSVFLRVFRGPNSGFIHLGCGAAASCFPWTHLRPAGTHSRKFLLTLLPVVRSLATRFFATEDATSLNRP